uniref:Uncharacterized protein n=1 Tax=Vitis vinifera TaxID=29760 RepID=A5B4A1_VITVI|nr:hypothetical protein VITISV_026951 [Vitis vinifera]
MYWQGYSCVSLSGNRGIFMCDYGNEIFSGLKDRFKVVGRGEDERFNGYLDGMKTMFRRESPDDAGLTWMIEALRAGKTSRTRLGTLSARIREGDAFGEGRTTSRTILGTLSARIRESDAFEEARTTSCTILGTLSAYIRREGDTKREEDQQPY